MDLFVFFLAEFESVLQVAVGCAKGILARLGQFLSRVHNLNGSLLKLYGIASCGNCNADQSLGEIDIAVMVDAATIKQG